MSGRNTDGYSVDRLRDFCVAMDGEWTPREEGGPVDTDAVCELTDTDTKIIHSYGDDGVTIKAESGKGKTQAIGKTDHTKISAGVPALMIQREANDRDGVVITNKGRITGQRTHPDW